jgi:predicted DsbA family dithiol-disulfide isomerase
VTWRPFELHEDTPAEGIPVAEYFGRPREQVERMQEGLRNRAGELGLPFASPEILSNTRKAHILSEYARDEGKFEALHRELFRANFVEGRNLADDVVLREMAGRAGLDPEAAMASLERPDYRERVERSLERAREIGITGVPTFIVDDKYMVVGAHPYEALRDAFRRIVALEGHN